MKRMILLTVLSLAIMVWLSSVNCSNPLEADNGADPFKRIDTVFRNDTTFVTDTLEGDTLIVTDTLVDTLIQEDTVIVTINDTVYVPVGEPFTICSIIQYNLNELIWTFNNPAGSYNLLFTVEVEREFTFRELIVSIDGDEYSWYPFENPELSLLDIDLNENVTIRIKPDVPLLLGHQVDLCLAICELTN